MNNILTCWYIKPTHNKYVQLVNTMKQTLQKLTVYDHDDKEFKK